MELISVILPIYNVDKYLKQCLDSILNQTYKNLEIILVDDGSKDNSGKICDKYSKKDNRIKVIHKRNGGVSSARNTGLHVATGEYISFIDPDDFVEPYFIEKMHALMVENDCDIVQCDFFRYVDGNIIDEIVENSKVEKISVYEFQKRLYTDNYIQTAVLWDKIYKKYIFDNIIFPEGKINEDEAKIHEIIDACNSDVIVTNQRWYYYRSAPNSIMKKKYNVSRLDIIPAMQSRLKFFKEKNEQELYFLTLIKYQELLKCNYYLAKKYLKQSKYIELIKKELRNNYKEYISISQVRLIDKIKYTILTYFTFVYALFFHIYLKKKI